MGDNMFGWELLWNLVKNDVKKKEDIVLLLIHHSLLKYEFKCAGLTETWPTENTMSEILPQGWNSSKEYVIRYKLNDDKYLLTSTNTDGNVVIFNLALTVKLKVSNLICNLEQTVKSTNGDIANMVPTYKELLKEIKEKLIDPIIESQKIHAETQTAEKTSSRLADDSFNQPSRCRPHWTNIEPAPPDYTSVGYRDLDPLAAMGSGGMILDPFSRNRNRLPGVGIPEPLPRGFIPPGARFDPFGPPDVGGPNRRFPPEYDDMFS